VRLQESVLGRERHHVEVQPPQADGGGHAQDGREQQRRADGLLGRAHPDGDHRLADGQDDEQPVPFGEVGHAVQPPVAVPGGEIGADPLDQEGTANSSVWVQPPSSAPATSKAAPATVGSQVIAPPGW
jgi:hypothetical protein